MTSVEIKVVIDNKMDEGLLDRLLKVLKMHKVI